MDDHTGLIGSPSALKARPTFLTMYQSGLALLAAGVIFTNLGRVMSDRGVLPLSFAAWAAAVIALSAPVILSFSRWRVFASSHLLLWGIYYLCVSSLGFIIAVPTISSFYEYSGRIFAVVFLLSMVVVFTDKTARTLGARAVAVGVVAATVLNVYELFNPMTFSVVWRPAGLYLNPNISALAIIVGLIASMPVLGPRQQRWLVWIAGLGVFCTLSRAGIVLWILSVSLMVVTGNVRTVGLLKSAVAFAVVFGLLLGLSGRLEVVIALLTSPDLRLLDRFVFSGSADIAQDISVIHRVDAAREALAMFSDHPIFGAGLATTSEWHLPQSTHNIYLKHLAEHGVSGVFAFPLLGGGLLAYTWRAKLHFGSIFAIVLLMAGMFSHNLLEERYILVVLALVAASSVQRDATVMRDETDHLKPEVNA